MLVFALRVCYTVTTGEDEVQSVLVGSLRLPVSILDIDLLFSSYISPPLQIMWRAHRRSVNTLIVNRLMEPP